MVFNVLSHLAFYPSASLASIYLPLASARRRKNVHGAERYSLENGKPGSRTLWCWTSCFPRSKDCSWSTTTVTIVVYTPLPILVFPVWWPRHHSTVYHERLFHIFRISFTLYPLICELDQPVRKTYIIQFRHFHFLYSHILCTPIYCGQLTVISGSVFEKGNRIEQTRTTSGQDAKILSYSCICSRRLSGSYLLSPHQKMKILYPCPQTRFFQSPWAFLTYSEPYAWRATLEFGLALPVPGGGLSASGIRSDQYGSPSSCKFSCQPFPRDAPLS